MKTVAQTDITINISVEKANVSKIYPIEVVEITTDKNTSKIATVSFFTNTATINVSENITAEIRRTILPFSDPM